MDRLLVVEDTPSLRDVLCAVLRSEGFDVVGTESAEEALSALETGEFSLVLTDLKLPGKSGIDFLQQSKALRPTLPVVVMTAFGSIDIAVQAMKMGASDFITKPFDPPMLVNYIHQVIEHDRIIDREPGRHDRPSHKLLTQSTSFEEVLLHARKVAPLTSPVLILGESGTGKELLAQFIHQNSRRAEKPFVAVNCGSMPEELLESEFFGHEPGSFTGATNERIGLFEVANKGTVFLDEIGNMPHQLQVKLLRTLQESEIKKLGSNKIQKIDVRIISATNCNLDTAMKSGTFREDLYYRLGVMILEIPPLRERPEDVELLASYFTKFFAAQNKKEVPQITSDALSALRSYNWPGNVRELENVIERAVIFTKGSITQADLQIARGEAARPAPNLSLTDLSHEAARKAEIEAIVRVLNETHGNKSKAAKILGVSYKTLLNKVKEFRLEEKDESESAPLL